MITIQHLKHLKEKYSHIFAIEENGNLTFKSKFGILPFKLIFITGGEYIMGDNRLDDTPEHKVKVSSFFMAEFPVIQELYYSVMRNNPSNFQGENNPVEQVSWYNTIAFCRILNQKLEIPTHFYKIDKEKKDKNSKSKIDELKWRVYFKEDSKGFRLPTEAEWEFAAKGATTGPATLYAGSNNLNEVGWYNMNSGEETKPVGLKFPNQLGIYDLCGNVAEWCWDWFDKYNEKTIEDPLGPKKGAQRVLRGGSWADEADGCKVAERGISDPGVAPMNAGFRLVFED